MAKNLSVSVLMDYYGGLLTDKQKDAMELYYNQDFSLAEIAENMDISRQGVRDFIKRGEKQLEEFEEELGLLKLFAKINTELSSINDSLLALNKMKLSKETKDILSDLSEKVKKIENYL